MTSVSKKSIRPVICLFSYWLIFLIIYKSVDLDGFMFPFIFVYMFAFGVPYKLSKIGTTSGKIIFTFVGVVLPLLLFILFVDLSFLDMVNN